MSAREAWRRIAIWAVVAGYLVVVIADAGHGDMTGLIGFTGFPVVGAVILMSRPRNGIGWFCFAYGIAWILGSYAVARLFEPENLVVALLTSALANLMWPCLPLIGAIFPSGRTRTRIGAVGFWGLLGTNVAFAIANLFAPRTYWTDVQLPNPLGAWVPDWLVEAAGWGWGILAIASIALIVVDVVVRWRRSVGATRQQLRWFGFGLIAALVVYLPLGFTSNALADSMPEWLYRTLMVVAMLSLELIPLSIGIAVTRHGLYDIGRVISRTVAYAIAIAIAVGAYAAIVLGIGALLPGDSPVLVAIATLVAAAVFLPLLRSVQRRLDRAFDRERYDAGQVVEAFGEQLRTDPDPTVAGAELVSAVERALQPAALGVWSVRGIASTGGVPRTTAESRQRAGGAR